MPRKKARAITALAFLRAIADRMGGIYPRPSDDQQAEWSGKAFPRIEDILSEGILLIHCRDIQREFPGEFVLSEDAADGCGQIDGEYLFALR